MNAAGARFQSPSIRLGKFGPIRQHLAFPRYLALSASATMAAMSIFKRDAVILALASFSFLAGGLRAQTASATGSLEFAARITPTAARPEPVRQFTFYLLTKSYADIAKDVEANDKLPSREQFIEDLKISPELREWLKAHDILDLTLPEMDKMLTPDDILHVPEFLLAYQRTNSGGVTQGIPKPRYRDADKKENPERYERQHQEYITSLKKFISSRPETVNGVELELNGVNPQTKWAKIQGEHARRVSKLAPELAQTRYLAAKVDTDLEGRAALSGMAAGNYWISTLNLDVAAGDTHLRWDVAITVQPGRTTRLELTNLNATDAHAATP